jgi:hypothetical protein
LSESDLDAAKNIEQNQHHQTPHQITQSQQVRRILARREGISAVSGWVQWSASSLQPSKTRMRLNSPFLWNLAIFWGAGDRVAKSGA